MKEEQNTPATRASAATMPEIIPRAYPEERKDNSRFAIQTITGITLLRYDDVILFEYHKNVRKWQIRLTDDKVYSLRSTVTSAGITALSPLFVQINQYCIINLAHLQGIENKTLHCLFDVHIATEADCRVSSLYYRRIRELLEIL
ncbi:MAG: LytTR family transcriptional regulator DNA-binding domain-containing protein [Tannerellaceae bacterium]|jgi:two-component system LytT family response regulator|nr:LytTR family transcriptional regulator DNA-binding domain-containing protein [Tannerellaceae bacterium]